MLLREAIDTAILHRMTIRRYGSLQYQVGYREDMTLEHSSLCDTLEEAAELIISKRLERDEQEQGDKKW